MIIQIILISAGIAVLASLLNWLDYGLMKKKYLESETFDLNICCGDTSCGGINADIDKRDVPGFVLIKDIYNLPFKNKQFKNTICSHTMEHVDDPVKFLEELKRVSENVTVLIPPLWDFGCMVNVLEHKRQFLTLTSRHRNELPGFFNLPFSGTVQNIFGQRIY